MSQPIDAVNIIHALDLKARLAIIEGLSISELNNRQPLLVSLMADIVNHVTENGEETESKPLESQSWWNALSVATELAGFKMLGNGHFSVAYSHEMMPGRVLKVGLKKEDSGAAYVAFCRMMQGKAGIPNVYHVERHAGCYTVILDHLEPCDRWVDDSHRVYADIAHEFIESEMEEGAEQYYDESAQDFINTCREIRKFFKGIASFDMHSGNIMFSKGGIPYITDPVSFSHDRSRDSFPLDPDALIAEINEVMQCKMIERCMRRKAKRDIAGTYWVNKKESMARRKEAKRRNDRLLKVLKHDWVMKISTRPLEVIKFKTIKDMPVKHKTIKIQTPLFLRQHCDKQIIPRPECRPKGWSFA